MGSQANRVVLSVKDVTKHFGGVHVLNGVSLELKTGEVLGLVGPNGAGKSVLQSCIAGALIPDGGDIRIAGTRTNGWSPEKLCHHGVSRTFQIPQPFLRMTVRETVLVGAMFGTGRRISRSEALRRADEALDFVGFRRDRELPVAELNTVELKRIDLARAIACQPKLLMVDEVAAGLMSGEIHDIVKIVRSVGERGIGVIMVEHIIHSIMAACSRVVVLQQGRIIADGVPEAVTRVPEVVEAYFGSEAKHA